MRIARITRLTTIVAAALALDEIVATPGFAEMKNEKTVMVAGLRCTP